MEQHNKEPKLIVAFIGAMFVILVLLLWIIFRKPEPVLVPGDTQKYKDSIKVLTQRIEEQKVLTSHYLHTVDSLKALPPVITIIYREQKRFTSVATVDQLDSIIRANSGLGPRIKRHH
jgi:hypothetical protein